LDRAASSAPASIFVADTGNARIVGMGDMGGAGWDVRDVAAGTIESTRVYLGPTSNDLYGQGAWSA